MGSRVYGSRETSQGTGNALAAKRELGRRKVPRQDGYRKLAFAVISGGIRDYHRLSIGAKDGNVWRSSESMPCASQLRKILTIKTPWHEYADIDPERIRAVLDLIDVDPDKFNARTAGIKKWY